MVVARIVWVGLASGMWRRRRRRRSGGLARKKRSTKNEKRKVKEKNKGKSKAIGAIHGRGGVYILKGAAHRDTQSLLFMARSVARPYLCMEEDLQPEMDLKEEEYV